MARKEYWINTFRESIPVFLSEWYIRHFAQSDCDEIFGTVGVDFIKGASSMKVRDIGQEICRRADSIGTILTYLESSKCPITKDLNRQLIQVHPNFESRKSAIQHRLWTPLGEFAKRRSWWKQNEKALRKLSLDLGKTKKVLDA